MSEQIAQLLQPGTHPDMPAPASIVGLRGWLQQNLLSSPLNIGLTIISLYLVYIIVPPVLSWGFIDADWRGETREDCDRVGACWVYIRIWFKQLMYGRYPVTELLAHQYRLHRAHPGRFIPCCSFRAFPTSTGSASSSCSSIRSFAFVMLLVGDTAGLEIVETPQVGRPVADAGDRRNRHRRIACPWASCWPSGGARTCPWSEPCASPSSSSGAACP